MTSLLSAFLVVVKELSPNVVMPLMKRLTGQHWVTHSTFAVVVFVVFGIVFGLANGVRKCE